MVDQAIGGFVSISQQIVNEFPGMWTRSASCLKNKRDQMDVWVPVKFGLLRSLGHKTWFCAGSRHQGRIAREGSNDGDMQIRDRTVTVEDKIHPSVFGLSIDHTSEGRYFLFNKYFDPTVRMNDIRKASRQCCMSATNTSSISAAIATMLFRIERFVANDTCRTFVGAKLYHDCRVGSSRVREHQSSGN